MSQPRSSRQAKVSLAIPYNSDHILKGKSMVRILVLCGGGEPFYSSSQGFIAALRELKCDVWSAGRRYFDRCLTDVELPPRQHPEYYSYKEVLDQSPWIPDLAICFDPGGFFSGEKPKGLRSILISTDAHRCGAMLREVIKKGSYDLFVNMQPNYSHFFTDLVKVHTSIPAFDERRFSLDVHTEPVADISFCGQTGLALKEEHWNHPDGQDEVGRYISNLKDRLPPNHLKYEFNFLPSFDYSERGELLYRLSQDFDLRIYEPLWDERLQLALQKGRVGIGCSILRDLSLRSYEVGASGRPLVTDDVRVELHAPTTSICAYPLATYLYWSQSYKPFYDNFSLTCGDVRGKVEMALSYNSQKSATFYRERNFANHSWKSRAQEILRTMKI